MKYFIAKKNYIGNKNGFANNSIAQIITIPQVYILVKSLIQLESEYSRNKEKNPSFNSRENIPVIKLREKTPVFNSIKNIPVIQK